MKLQEKRRYRITASDGKELEFYPMTIDRIKNELYIKIVSPLSSHQGFVLSSFESNPNKIEDITDEYNKSNP
jgi:hypothetical protein